MQKELQQYLEHMCAYITYKYRCMSVPVDLHSLARALGATVTYEAMSAWGCVESNQGTLTIRIRADAAPARQRFSLAHEIGHILIDRLNERQNTPDYKKFRHSARVGTVTDEETIADEIAGLLLLPTWFLRPYASGSMSLCRIAAASQQAGASLSVGMIRTVSMATSPCAVFLLQQTDKRPTTLRWIRCSDRRLQKAAKSDLASDSVLDAVWEGNSRFCGASGVQWDQVETIQKSFEGIVSRFGLAQFSVVNGGRATRPARTLMK